MKKNFLFLISGIFIMLFHSCCVPMEDRPDNGVINFDTLQVYAPADSTNKVDSTNVSDSLVVAGYNWNIVDTTGGFSTIATGIIAECSWQNAKCEAEIPLTIKETGFVKEMLVNFQKKFEVKITSFQAIRIYEDNQIYLRVFFEKIRKESPFRSNF